MGRIPMLALAALASCALAWPLAAKAEENPFAAWLGAYRNASVSDGQAVIAQAIEQGTSEMGPLRRKIGRKRLKAVNQSYKVLRIVESGDHLVLDFDGRRYSAPISGKPEKGVDPEGKDVTVSYRAAGRTLHARFVGDDGEKRIDFERAQDGGDLTMHVTILSEQLPAPIRYSLRYLRQP